MIEIFKRLFKKKTRYHYVAISEKDKSGRYRYKIYKDGVLIKENIYIDIWR